MNKFHETNRQRWDIAAPKWRAMHDNRGTWKVVHTQPDLFFIPEELALLGEVKGKRVCVLGSGDNLAVFALAGMGAEVTSVDISQEQIDTATERAKTLGLSVQFLRADVTDLNALGDDLFDIVYTGGHVAEWVADLRTFYGEAIRILKSDGLLLINEYHPFRRIWQDHPDALKVRFSYFNHGPHYSEVSEGLFDEASGKIPTYEFQWTVSDYLKSVMEQGCELITLEEIGDESEGWESKPLAGLPQMLLIAGRKK